MDTLKKFFPFSFKANDVTSLIISIVIYVVIGVVFGLVLGFLGMIPFVGIILMIAGWAGELYVAGGIVLSLLHFFKIIE